MAWDPLTQPCDYILLAGKQSPGYAEVIGAWDEREFAVHQPPFTTGAKHIYKRKKLAEFSVRFRLYTLEQHAEFAVWRALIDAKPDVRRAAKAMAIEHPLLNQLGIGDVVVKGVSQFEQTADGEWSLSVSFQESRPIGSPTLAKIEGSTSGPGDPVERQIDENTAVLKGLMEELSR